MTLRDLLENDYECAHHDDLISHHLTDESADQYVSAVQIRLHFHDVHVDVLQLLCLRSQLVRSLCANLLDGQTLRPDPFGA